MTVRYLGDLKIEIRYYDDGDYRGKITTKEGSWKFKGLRAPAIGLPFAYDSSEAYDLIARSAVSFMCHEVPDLWEGNPEEPVRRKP